MTFKTTLFVLFLFFYSFVLFMCLIFDWHPVWSHTGLNFTANTFPFGDIQSITNYLESKNSGLNPKENFSENAFCKYKATPWYPASSLLELA